MRTALTIGDDVLISARALAARQRRSLGEVISDLSRKGLLAQGVAAAPCTRNGVPLLRRDEESTPLTLALVNRLRDETA